MPSSTEHFTIHTEQDETAPLEGTALIDSRLVGEVVQGGNPVTWLNEDGEEMTGDALYKSNDGTCYFVYPPEAWAEVAKPEVMFFVPHQVLAEAIRPLEVTDPTREQ